jgi:hypothetical protein
VAILPRWLIMTSLLAVRHEVMMEGDIVGVITGSERAEMADRLRDCAPLEREVSSVDGIDRFIVAVREGAVIHDAPLGLVCIQTVADFCTFALWEV